MTTQSNLRGPFGITTIQEFESNQQELNFIFPNLNTEEFAATRAFTDSRFVDPSNGLPRMSYHSTILRTPQGTILVDTCVGAHKERPLIAEWHLQEYPYLERLQQAGLTPDDIDYVCCTHLHGDHVGWNTRLENGRWVPTFPNARYLIAAPEYDYWEQFHGDNPDHIFRQSWDDSVLPVITAGQVDKISCDHEIVNGVQLQHAPGHSPGNVVISVDDGKARALLTGDVLHHPVQIERPDWCTFFDDDSQLAMQTRLKILADIADTETVMFTAHFGGATPLLIESAPEYYRYKDVS
jgi:glyoxylase-like metal-dependent hydrolase (beta-lactamase superfamily II)